jgi:hypothetical protein
MPKPNPSAERVASISLWGLLDRTYQEDVEKSYRGDDGDDAEGQQVAA